MVKGLCLSSLRTKNEAYRALCSPWHPGVEGEPCPFVVEGKGVSFSLNLTQRVTLREPATKKSSRCACSLWTSPGFPCWVFYDRDWRCELGTSLNSPGLQFPVCKVKMIIPNTLGGLAAGSSEVTGVCSPPVKCSTRQCVLRLLGMPIDKS